MTATSPPPRTEEALLESIRDRLEALEQPHRHCACGLSMDQYSEQCTECMYAEEQQWAAGKEERERRDFLAKVKAATPKTKRN